MLVSELREIIKKYNVEDLKLIISEMYKSMPKKLREDKDIDEMLKDVHAFMNIGKVEKSSSKQVNIIDLKREIDQFIDFAYKQYYYAPNNYVHKKERPKWRFKVKAFIKDLQGIPLDGEDGQIATELLQKLYEMLSYACAYYIFNTEDPFRSVGIEQTLSINIVLSRILGSGISKDSVKRAIELVINSRVDRETLPSYLIMELINNLKTTDSKEIAIQQCISVKAELKKPKQDERKKLWLSDSSDYQHIEKSNNLTEMVFRLNMSLNEYDEGIRYYNENCIDRDKEVTLYKLLGLLLEYELKDHWLREYELALKRGVKPRETLIKTQKYIVENDKLPEYFIY